MSYTQQSDGMYHIPIADFGRRLQDNFGLTIVEHPEFGGVGNMHAENSYHHYGEAIDIQDWRGGSGDGSEGFDGVGYVQRTKNLRDRLKGSGAEVIGPGDMAGHDTHLHLAGKGGVLRFNEDQYNYFYGGNAGGRSSTFAGGEPPINTPASPQQQPERSEAKGKAQDYTKMSKAQLDSAYDAMRSDPAKARTEGMKMHKAYFGKK